VATLEQIREALAAAVRTAMPDRQVSAYMLSNPTPPAVHLYPSNIDYHKAFGNGLEPLTFEVQAFVAAASGDIGSQKNLDRFLDPGSPTSLKAALESDVTLGGLVNDLIVRSASGYRQFVTQDRGYMLGCTWTLDIYPDTEE
jgi:hypothetical protein